LPCLAANPRVLVADDEATSRLLLQRTLERWGYPVDVASDGAEAWAVLQRPDAPALAVIDWMMPGLDGPAICHRVRARSPDQPYTYVILLTSRAESRDVVDGLGSGADDYLVKPVDLLQLQARLRVGQRILALESTLRAERAEYQRRAMHDPLTGIWNRGALMDAVGREVERGRREGRCVALIMLDIDRFKSINDTYGHGVGDEVIIETARRLTRTMRPYDHLGRMGGEEFLAVVTCPSQQDVAGLAERLRLAIARAPFATTAGAVSVTVSLGVATTAVLGFDGMLLVRAADQVLYRAKHKGRNRVELQERAVTPDPPTVPG
jgi:diguanylate cyclase (GGDEF)-like protein